MSLPPLLTTVDTYTQSALEFQHLKENYNVGSPSKDARQRNTMTANSLKAAKPKEVMDKSMTAGGRGTPRFRGNGSKHVVRSAESVSKESKSNADNENNNSINSNNAQDGSATIIESNQSRGSALYNIRGALDEQTATAGGDRGGQRPSKRISILSGKAAIKEKQTKGYLMGEEVHASFAKAIEMLAAIRLHAFSRKRKDMIQQKMDLLNEIRTYQQDNFQDSVDSIQDQFQFMLAAWKIRFFLEVVRFKQLKSRYQKEKKANADKEDKLKRELDQISLLVNEKRIEYDNLRQHSAKTIDELRISTSQLSDRESKKISEVQALEKKIAEKDEIISKLQAQSQAHYESKLLESNIKFELEDKISNLNLELALTRKTCEDIILKNAQLERDNIAASKIFETLDQVQKEYETKVEMLEASFQSKQSIVLKENDNLLSIIENDKLIIAELNQRITALEDSKQESHAAFENQTINNVDMAAELSRAEEEKASLQVVITDLALKYQKLELDNTEKVTALEKIQTKYNLSRVQKAELKIIAQIMETEIHGLKDRLKHEEENMVEHARLYEQSLMKVEDVEVAWASSLNSLIKTAGYCRFLEDQLFSMRKIRGQTPNSGGFVDNSSIDNQLFSTWSDSAYNPNSSSSINGSRITNIEGNSSPNKNKYQNNADVNSRRGNNSSNGHVSENNKRVAFDLSNNSDGDVSNSNKNNASAGGSGKITSVVQSLEDKIKLANQLADDARKLMESNLSGDTESSPSKGGGSGVVSYTTQKTYLLRVYGNIEKKVSRTKDEISDDLASIKRSYDSINDLLDRKMILANGVQSWWDKWLLTNLKVPSEDDYKWHLSVIGETIEGCDLNIYSVLSSIFEVVFNLKQKRDFVADLENLFSATKLALQNLNKGVNNDEVNFVLQEFERLEIESSHMSKIFADPDSVIEPQKLLEQINSRLVEMNMQPFHVFWSCAIPAYICFVNNDFPVAEKPFDESDRSDTVKDIVTVSVAEAKTNEIYQINLKKTQDVERLLIDLKTRYETNITEITDSSVQISKEEEKMKDWVVQFIKICKRDPILLDKQTSALFQSMFAKYESLKGKLLNLYNDSENIQMAIIKYKDMHISLVEFLKDHCKICFKEGDVDTSVIYQCEFASKNVISRTEFKSFQEIGNDIYSNYLSASPGKGPPPTATPGTPISALEKRRGVLNSGNNGNNKPEQLASANLFDKVVYCTEDLSTDEFLGRMKSESESLKQQLQDAKSQRKVLQKKLNEASRLLNIWLDSYKASHEGKEPSEDVIYNLARDIIDGFNSCSLALNDNATEISSINRSIKERREILNRIVVLRNDIKDLTWFEEDDAIVAMGDDPVLINERTIKGTLSELKSLRNRDDALVTSLIISDSLQSQSLVSDISFSLENQKSDILGGGVAEVRSPNRSNNNSSNQSERPITDFEISSAGLVEIDKEIFVVKNNIKELKSEYERIKEQYKTIDQERATSRNALNEWVEKFRETNNRIPTEAEKHSECQTLLTSLQLCQDRLIECFTSMSELKSRFDRGQTRLQALKERRDKIGDTLTDHVV